MRVFLWVIFIVIQLMLLITLSWRLQKYKHSRFMLKQILSQYSGEVQKTWRKFYELIPVVTILVQIKIFVFFGASVTMASYLNNPVAGLLYALVAFLVLSILSQISYIQNFTDKLFEKNLHIIIKVVEPTSRLVAVFNRYEEEDTIRLKSKEELLDFVQYLPLDIINKTQKRGLLAILGAQEKTVKDIMTPKKQVISVAPSATLGPVLLSDLQSSGHLYFPVSSKKGQPEGLLRLSDLSDINNAKQHHKASDLMSSYLAWVSEDFSILNLAQVFSEEKQHMLFVKDFEDNFVGIITITDIINNIFGISKE